MNETEKQRQERRQRMLAREQGREWVPGDTQPGTDTGAGVRVPKKVRRSDTPDPPEIPRPNPTVGHLKPLSPLLRRRKRRRRLLWAALIAAVLAAVLVLSGLMSGLGTALRDAADSAFLYLTRSGGAWPVSTGITAPTRAEALGGGFLLMDNEDVAVYSAYGAHVRTIQPGYGRPALAVGSKRFVLYNRAGTDLRVESRTDTVYTKTFEGELLLCALSDNGSLAAVTQTDRFPAVLQVLDPGGRAVITYSLAQEDGVPVTADFAPDNRRLAVGALAAENGQMQSLVYLLDTGKETLGTCYRADAGSEVLRVQWLAGNRVLAVCDSYLTILDAATGAETARYAYGGAVLRQAETAGRQMALLLAVRGGNTLVTLDENLVTLARVPTARSATIAAGESAVYVLDGDTVSCYSYDGVNEWQQSYGTRPQAVLPGDPPLLVASGTVEPLTGP